MRRSIDDVLRSKRKVFLDSAPVIYTLGEDPSWSLKAKAAIRYCIEAGLPLLSSPVTLAECLAGEPDPLKGRNPIDFLLRTSEIDSLPIDDVVGIQAGLLRQRRGWKLPDCLQMAFALRNGCDAFLTNDSGFANTDLAIDVILLSELA